MNLKIRSRHPSHDILRGQIRVNQPTVFRLGSTTEMPGHREINTVDACMNSANKKEMKRLFIENEVKTAIYCNPANEDELVQWATQNRLIESKLIIKSYRGSRGRGLYLVNNLQEAVVWFANNGRPKYGGYIVEKYYNYNREYRLHVSKNGCFYTCRKMLKTDATERWYRNDSNSVWIMEENADFNKPANWDLIVEHCVKALNAVGLDVGACDVRVQSNPNNPDFIICEINSAPSFGAVTFEKYKQELINLCAI
jgi:glutathione synthase/RimK-type ligase-like ATP-grasp enzyme